MIGLIRVALALAVFFSHTRPLDGLFPIAGGSAVYSFFVISGFLIAKNIGSVWSAEVICYLFPLKYLWYRWSRLYPLYLISLLFSVAVVVFGSLLFSIAYGPLAIWPNLSTMEIVLLAMSHISLFGLNLHNWSTLVSPQFWTLSVELNFYLLFAVIYSIAKHIGRSFRLTFLSGFYCFLMALAAVCLDGFFEDPHSLFYGFNYFIFGIAVCYIRDFYCSILTRESNKEYLHQLFFVASLFVVLFGRDVQWIAPYVIGVSLLVLGEKKHKLDGFFGDLSYSIYLIHLPVMLIISALVGRKPLEIYSESSIVFGVFLITLVSALLTIFVKKFEFVFALRKRHISFGRKTASRC